MKKRIREISNKQINNVNYQNKFNCIATTIQIKA